MTLVYVKDQINFVVYGKLACVCIMDIKGYLAVGIGSYCIHGSRKQHFELSPFKGPICHSFSLRFSNGLRNCKSHQQPF